jgi:hypothetical protein
LFAFLNTQISANLIFLHSIFLIFGEASNYKANYTYHTVFLNEGVRIRTEESYLLEYRAKHRHIPEYITLHNHNSYKIRTGAKTQHFLTGHPTVFQRSSKRQSTPLRVLELTPSSSYQMVT